MPRFSIIRPCLIFSLTFLITACPSLKEIGEHATDERDRIKGEIKNEPERLKERAKVELERLAQLAKEELERRQREGQGETPSPDPEPSPAQLVIFDSPDVSDPRLPENIGPIDFGRRVILSAKNPYEHRIRIDNKGGRRADLSSLVVSPLESFSLSTSGFERSCGSIIEPKDYCYLFIQFSPYRAGSFEGRLRISYNSFEREVERAVRGEGTAPAFLRISSSDFGPVRVGETKQTFIRVQNVGLEAASEIHSKVDPRAPFSFTGGSYPGLGGTCGRTLLSATECTLSVTFHPTTASEIINGIPKADTQEFVLMYFDGSATKDTPGSLSGIALAKTLVTNLRVVNPGGAYKAASQIDIQVLFNNPVVIRGLPRILLETGAVDHYAVYVSGSESSTLTFRYVVMANDMSERLRVSDSSERIELLASDSIVDKDNSPADLSIPSYARRFQTEIVIDTHPPLAPTTPVADGGSTSRITFRWTDSAVDDGSGITSYNIQITRSLSESAVLSGTVTDRSYSFDAVIGNTYYARVQAVDKAGNVSLFSSYSLGARVEPPPVLSIQVLSNVLYRDQGSSTGSVSRTGTRGTLTVSLSSSDPSMVSVPSSITIPEGVSTSEFPITILVPPTPPLEMQPVKFVGLTASLAGSHSGRKNLQVLDRRRYDYCAPSILSTPGYTNVNASSGSYSTRGFGWMNADASRKCGISDFGARDQGPTFDKQVFNTSSMTKSEFGQKAVNGFYYDVIPRVGMYSGSFTGDRNDWMRMKVYVQDLVVASPALGPESRFAYSPIPAVSPLEYSTRSRVLAAFGRVKVGYQTLTRGWAAPDVEFSSSPIQLKLKNRSNVSLVATLLFSENINTSTLDSTSLRIEGPTGILSPSLISILALTPSSFQITINAPYGETLSRGTYSFHVGPHVRTQVGNSFDFDGDGLPGENEDDVLTLELKDALRFDFIGASALTEEGYIAVPYDKNFRSKDAANLFGWNFSVTPVEWAFTNRLRRDMARFSGARTFSVRVARGRSYNVRIYLGSPKEGSEQTLITVEGANAFWTPSSSYPLIYEMGTTGSDQDGNGILTIAFSSIWGDFYTAGMDIWEVGTPDPGMHD